MYKIVTSPIFKICLDRLVHFLEHKHSITKASETKQIIKKSILDNLSENPEIAPISQRLVKLGIKDYRQYMLDKHNIVFYRIDKANKKIILLAVMDSRQNIQKLLSEVMLIS